MANNVKTPAKKVEKPKTPKKPKKPISRGGMFAIGAAVGAVAGGITGILTAPKSGAETRKDLEKKGKEALSKVDCCCKKKPEIEAPKTKEETPKKAVAKPATPKTTSKKATTKEAKK